MATIRLCCKLFKMKTLSVLLFFVVVSFSGSTAFVAPEKLSQNALVPLQRQQFDLFESSRRVIEQLIATLRKAGRDAYDAVARIGTNVQETAASVRDRVVNNIQKLRERVDSAIESLRNRLIDSGVAIVDCIASHSGDANVIFNDTVTKTMTCVDDRISEVGEQITSLRTLTNDAMDYGNKALDDMKKCSDAGGSFLQSGTCFGTVTIQTEWKAMVFATQSAFALSRINLSMATLPAALEVCAGSRLVDAGMSTAKVLMEIGTCSATSVFSTMTGNVETQTEVFKF